MSFIEPRLLETLFAGFVVAVAFPIGALIAIYVNYSARRRVLFAAFGAGIFFATVMLLTQCRPFWFSSKLHQTLQSLQ